MAWQRRFNELLGDALRVTVRTVLFLNVFIAAIGSVYFVAKFVYFLLRWLDSTMFSEAW